MASVPVEPNVKSNRCSNPSRKVRLIGKIKGLTDGDSQELSQNSKSWITVKNSEEIGSSEKCKVFFETQSTSRKDGGYELDYCYGEHEEIDQIYSREIQPMILEVFDGRNASVIALGARGSGKTYTIQGSQEKPGIAVMAMSEILSKAKELEKSVSVSLYELTREHVKDILNPDHPAIQVLEDAQGKINIKGLSQVTVKSIIEFHDIYFTKGGSQNDQKSLTDQTHKGLMVHISSGDDKKKAKINFVDLAGYQDLRRSKDGITPAESNRKNKSLYALLNVVSAINANETRVPYRESILTRILQDSLGGRSHVLLLACLNHSFCQDSLSTISLVSRSYQTTKQVFTDSTNRSLVSQSSQSSTKQVFTDSTDKSSAKTKELSSLKSGKTMAPTSSTNKSLVSQSSQSTKQAFTDSTDKSSAKTKELSSLKSGKKMEPTFSTNKSLVSQSSQSTKQAFTDSTDKSSAKTKELSSLKSGKKMEPTSSTNKSLVSQSSQSTKQVCTDSTDKSSAKTKELSSLKSGKKMEPTSSTNKSLVSQSSQSTKQVFTDSTDKSSAKTKELSSLKTGKTMAPTSSTDKSLVSQSSQSTKQVFTDYTNRSSAKMKELSSLKNGKTMAPTSLSMMKQIDSRHLSTTKASSISKGRKPFDEVKKVNSKQLGCQSEDASMQKSKTLPSSDLVVTPFSLEEATQDTSVAECCSPVEVEQIQDVNLEESLSLLKLENTLDLEQTTTMKTDVSPHTGVESLGASTCEENNLFHMKDNKSPPLSVKIRELCNNLKELNESTTSVINISENSVVPSDSQVGYSDILEPKTPAADSKVVSYRHSPQGGTFSNRSSRMKDSVVKECLDFLNSANKEELKSLKYIGDKRATWILEMREESPIPFKTLDDLHDIGIYPKQIKGLMRQVAGFD